MPATIPTDIGLTIKQLLRGSWRTDPPSPDIGPQDLDACLDVLMTTGLGPLAWNRIRRSQALSRTGAGGQLHKRYHLSALFSAMQAELIDRIASLLNEAGITPIIFKGWSVASYYRPSHLRHCGDIDLCPPPARYPDAVKALAAHAMGRGARTTELEIGMTSTGFTFSSELPGQIARVDLQRNLEKFHLFDLNQVFARSRIVCLANSEVRVLASEDHLRLLCMHFLLDGGWRALTLCDVAAMLEALPDDFAWDLCLGDDPLARNWILTVLKLAHELLDACGDVLPAAALEHELPRWLAGAIISQWSWPFAVHMPKPRFGYVLQRLPHQIASQFAARWPGPVEATFHMRARFDASPRWPYQMRFFLLAGTRYLGRLLEKRAG